MPAPRSKQEAFAANLGGTALGMALYSPLPFSEPLLPPIAANIHGILTPPTLPSITENLAADIWTQRATVGARPSGKVGDVAFIVRDGKYQWLRNAFHTEVSLLAERCSLNTGPSPVELAGIHKIRGGRSLNRGPRALSHCCRRPILLRGQNNWSWY